MNKMQNGILALQKRIADTRISFELAVEQASLEVTHIAKDISKAIGREISLVEAQNAIAREFAERLKK